MVSRADLRIVTLLPSATEIVCALGLDKNLVGVSHSCNYPPGVRDLPAMTSTRVPYSAPSDAIDSFVREHLTNNAALYELDLPALQDAAPDVIVSQALCDVCAVSTGDVLSALHALPSRPVLVDLEPNTLNEVFDDCIRVGNALEQTVAAKDLVSELRHRRTVVAERTSTISAGDRPRVAFLEWLFPPFNGGHWNPELVQLAGGVDVLGAPGKASSSLDWDRVVASTPDVLFIACCGLDPNRTMEDIQRVTNIEAWLQIPAVATSNVFVADGDAYFSRPGPRLLDGLELMAHALHPEIHPKPHHGHLFRGPPW